MVKCQSCGGVYEPIQADGLQYFHRCPSLSRVELDAAVKAGKAQLPAGESVDDALARRVYERANLRDENPKALRGADAQSMKAPGAGVVDVAPAANPPQTIVPMTGVAVGP